MKATVSALLALLLLASPLAVLGAAQDDEPEITRDLQVEVTTGSTDRFGGGDWIRIDVGSTTFAVLYGNESNPNNPKMVAEYDRYLGAAEVYNESGGLVHDRTPLPVRTVMVQSFDFMLEFKDTDDDGLVHIPHEMGFMDILMGSFDLPRKILSLRQTWELEGLVIDEGEALTTVDFNITATNLDYTLAPDNPGDGLDRITFSFHIRVELVDSTLDVPVYNLTVSETGEIVGFNKLTETVTGMTVDGTFKYDHYIEGWDWVDDDSRLALVTHVFAGSFVPQVTAKFLRLEFALRALEDGRLHDQDTVGDRPLLITADSMQFEDEWEHVGRIFWVSDVTVDGQDMRMAFQLFRAEKIFDFRGLKPGIFKGVAFWGAFVYPQGNVIFHDPGMEAALFVPEGRIVAPGEVIPGLGPYFIQAAVVGLAVLGLVLFQVYRRRPKP